MSNTRLQFKIDQLRKDKMIYALESIATTGVVFIFHRMITQLGWFHGYQLAFAGTTYSAAIVYWLYVVFGNLKRYRQIKHLETKLLEEYDY